MSGRGGGLATTLDNTALELSVTELVWNMVYVVRLPIVSEPCLRNSRAEDSSSRDTRGMAAPDVWCAQVVMQGADAACWGSQ